MESQMTLLEWILAIIGGMFALSYGYGQWKQGKNQNSLDNDSIYKNRIEALELKVKTQSEDIENLSNQIKKLRLENEEANRKLLEAMTILQNRNPELVKFMEVGNSFMITTAPVIETLKRYLEKQII